MKIEISNIPGYFPTDYPEQIFIDASRYRVKSEQPDIVIFRTSEKIKVKTDENYRQRKIQSILYDKYTLSFIVTESTSIELLTIAGNVTVTLDNGEIHTAELLDVPEYEEIDNTDFKKVTITYRNLSTKTTINHLSASSSSDGIARFKSGITNTYTPIHCKLDVTDYEREENSDNAINIVSRDVAFRTIEFVAYLSQESIETIKRGLSFAYLDLFEIEYDGTTYEALEYPDINVEDTEYENLKVLRVILKYEQILNYPYA